MSLEQMAHPRRVFLSEEPSLPDSQRPVAGHYRVRRQTPSGCEDQLCSAALNRHIEVEGVRIVHLDRARIKR